MLAWVCHLARSLGDLVLYKAALLIPANFHVVSSFHLHLYFRLLQIMRYYFDTTLLCFFVLNKELNILSVFIFITLWRGRRRQEIWKMEARMFKPLAQRLIQSHQVSKRQKWNLWRSGRVPGEAWLRKHVHGQHLQEQMFLQAYCTARPTLAYLFLSAFIMLWGSSMIRLPIWYLY